MRFGKTIKKAIALGTGLTMLSGAMAAADLSNYPAPFIADGKFTGVMVVGDKAAAEDVIGVSDIAISLQFSATTAAGTATSSTSVEGDAWLVGTSTKNLELSELHRETLRNITTFIGKDELDALADGEVSNTKATSPYHQYLDMLGPGGENQDTGYVVYAEDENDVTDTFLYFKSGNEIGKYKIEFTTSFESDVDDSTGSATTTGTYLTDMEDVDIVMFGKTYTIVTARKTSATTNGGDNIKLTLMGGAVKDTLLEGETKTYSVEGTDYETTLDFVSSTQCKFTIGGEATRLLKDGDTDKLSDETEIGVSEILYQDYAGGIHSATFYLGAQKMELKDTQVEDGNGKAVHSNNLKIGDNTIDDAYVVIEGSNDNSTFKIDSMIINMSADDDYFVPVGGKLSEVTDMDEPEVLFTSQWDIEYHGLKDVETETIEIGTSGSSEYVLKFNDGSGNEVKLPIGKASTGVLRMAGDTDGTKTYINVENRTIAKNDYFLLTDGSEKRGERKSYIYQYKGADKMSADSPVLKFKDVGSGDTVEKSYSNSSTLATLKIGGADYNVERVSLETTDDADLSSNDFVITVDLDASGGLESHFNNLSLPITTKNGMEINVSNITGGVQAAANGVNVTFRIADDDRDGTAKDATETLLPSTYQVNIGESSAEVAFDSQITSLTERTPDGETDIQYTYDAYGSFYTRKSPSSDPGTLTIEVPASQRYAQVYIKAKGSTITSTATTSGEAVVVNRIEVGATKLASEVPDIKAVNAILVGGPCANAAAAEIMDNPADCTAGFEAGKGLIKLYENDGNVAMLVAGYSAADTRAAAKVVSNHGDYALEGEAREVTTATMAVTEVTEPVVEEVAEEEEEVAEEVAEE